MRWVSDQIDVTFGGDLVKPSEITKSVGDGGVRLSTTDADASLCALGWGEHVKGLQAQTALAKVHLEAPPWLE